MRGGYLGICNKNVAEPRLISYLRLHRKYTLTASCPVTSHSIGLGLCPTVTGQAESDEKAGHMPTHMRRQFCQRWNRQTETNNYVLLLLETRLSLGTGCTNSLQILDSQHSLSDLLGLRTSDSQLRLREVPQVHLVQSHLVVVKLLLGADRQYRHTGAWFLGHSRQIKRFQQSKECRPLLMSA